MELSPNPSSGRPGSTSHTQVPCMGVQFCWTNPAPVVHEQCRKIASSVGIRITGISGPNRSPGPVGHICWVEFRQFYSRCKTTTRPMIPSIAVFIHGCSESMIVTYPTKGMYPTTLLRPSVSFNFQECQDTEFRVCALPDNVFPVQVILSASVEFCVVGRVVVSLGKQLCVWPENVPVSSHPPRLAPLGQLAWGRQTQSRIS